MTDPTAAERIVKQWWKEDCGHHVEADDFQSQCVEGCLIKYLTTALAEARRAGVEQAIEAFMRDHNTKGKCEDDEGIIVCGCHRLANTIRRRSLAP